MTLPIPSTKLASRLAQLKAKTTPTSISDFLHIYSRATEVCYVDRFLGARLLVDYLKPIELPRKWASYLTDDRPLPKVRTMLQSYELTNLAQVISGWDASNRSLKAVRVYELAILEYYTQDLMT